MATYYNTTNENPNQVSLFTKINEGQDQEVLRVAKRLKEFTPWEVHSQMDGILITSVRRSIHSLLTDSRIKVIGKKVGPMGRPEKQYRVA